MQHGEINGPLNVKVVAASFEQRSNYLLNPAFFPEPPKDQVRPDALHRDSLSLAGGMRIDKGKLFAMAHSRAYQRLEPSAGLEFIEPAQSGVHCKLLMDDESPVQSGVTINIDEVPQNGWKEKLGEENFF